MGLALTTGSFFSGRTQFVTGAPHVNRGESGTGEIYFYELDPQGDRLETDSARTLSGGRFGAGYGFSLARLDCDGDGSDDLLVGAPFSEEAGRGGAVYLYLNRGRGLDQDRVLEIRGAATESQFGLALAAAGDLNKDGMEDWAVGAPYEGAGAVYLFLGGEGGLAGWRPGQLWLPAEEVASQVIRPEQLGLPVPAPGLATFGSSLSGGADLDFNHYPGNSIPAYRLLMKF